MKTKTGVSFVCFMIISAAISAAERPERIVLSYTPIQGETSAYDFQITSQIKDGQGGHISGIFAAMLRYSIDLSEPEVTLLRITQSHASYHLTTGDKTKGFELPEHSVLLKSTNDGKVQIQGGTTGIFSEDSIRLVYDTIGADEKLHRGKQWLVKTKLMLQGEMVPVEVLYTLADALNASGENCVIITARMKLDHTFSGGHVSRTELLLEGEAWYAYRLGRFVHKKISVSGNGLLHDGSRARIDDFTLVMNIQDEEPAADTVRTGGGIFSSIPFPPAFLLVPAVLLIVFAAIAKFAADALRQILTAALVALVMFWHVPIAPASTTGQPSAGLRAFHLMLYELMANGAGLTTAGAAGVVMGGTRSTLLGAAFTNVPAWSVTTGHEAAKTALPLSGAPYAAPAAAGSKTASAGLFSTSNMLIGGSIAAVGGGTAVVANQSGSSTGNLAGLDQQFVVFAGPMGQPLNPPGVVDIHLDGRTVMSNIILNSGPGATTETLSSGNDSITLEITYVSGGPNESAIVDVIVVLLPEQTRFMRTFTVSAGNPGMWTLNLR